MIARESIEDVKSRIDIIDVIGDFVTLKKSGQNYRALSPFTNEKTPSFYVVPSKGIFKDFSSGKGGDAISFLMEHEGMTYSESIRFLAQKYGVDLKEGENQQEGAEKSDREALQILMAYARDYFKTHLFEHEEGRGVGLSYFHERGFDDQIISKFELGYAVDAWENFKTQALKDGYNQQLLEKSGLLVSKGDDQQKEKGSYDRFRGRVIFPIYNISGKVLAFGARILGKEKKQAKYINSPETEIYHKSDVLYGLYQAKNAIRQLNNCYLVEGYTDVLSMHQADVENVVASSGTALTEQQIQLISRFSENVTVLFDGDAAGIKAALRGIDLILKGGLNVRVVLFPDGEDPDSYSRKVGTEAFQHYLKDKSEDFVSFKAGIYAQEAGKDPIRKAESIKEIVSSIALIPDPVKRSVYIQETSNLLKIGEPVLLNELNKILIGERRKREKEKLNHQDPYPITPELIEDLTAPNRIEVGNMVQYQERETIRLLLNYADQSFSAEDNQKVADFLLHELEDVKFTNPVFKEIYEVFKKSLDTSESISSHYFLQHGSESVKKSVTDLVASRYDISQHWGDKFRIHIPKEADRLEEMTYTNVLRLKFRVIQQMIEDNLQQIKILEEKGDLDELDNCLSQQEGLKQAEKELANLLGIVIAR